MIRLWLLALALLGLAALWGIRDCDVALAVVFIVGELLLPQPAAAGPIRDQENV